MFYFVDSALTTKGKIKAPTCTQQSAAKKLLSLECVNIRELIISQTHQSRRVMCEPKETPLKLMSRYATEDANNW